MYVPPPEVLPDVEYGLQKFAGLGQFKYLQAPPTATYDGQIKSINSLSSRNRGESIDAKLNLERDIMPPISGGIGYDLSGRDRRRIIYA